MTPEEDQLQKYLAIIEARSSTGEVAAPDSEGMESEDAAAKNYQQNAAQDYNKVAAAGVNPDAGKLSAAGDVTAGAGMMGGNPYVAGAGLGLKTVGMVDDVVRNSEQAKIDAYNKKIMAKRSAIRNIFA